MPQILIVDVGVRDERTSNSLERLLERVVSVGDGGVTVCSEIAVADLAHFRDDYGVMLGRWSRR